MSGVFYKRPMTIHLLGDSIARGFALANFADLINTTHPLYKFSSQFSMANMALEENGLNVRVQALGILGTFTTGGIADQVTAYISAGHAQPGDWMVFEDAGEHVDDPAAYQTALQGVLDAAASLNRICMTTPDYDHGFGTDYEWDHEYSGTSINEAIQAAAATRSVPCIDMNAIQDAYRTECLADGGVDTFLSDGVHPGVWGQMKWIGATLAAIGVPIATYETLKSLAAANHAALAYGGTMDATKAQTYCAAILG